MTGFITKAKLKNEPTGMNFIHAQVEAGYIMPEFFTGPVYSFNRKVHRDNDTIKFVKRGEYDSEQASFIM